MRPEYPLRKLVAHLYIVPPALIVAEGAQHADPAELAFFERLDFLVAPHWLVELGLVDVLTPGLRVISDRGRTLLGEQLPVLIGVEIVSALEAGRARKLGFLDHVVER